MFNYSPVFLDPPLESKILYRKGNPLFRVGAACMQGRRVDMEDTHCISLSLPKHPETGLFAIYDGHGGKVTSQYLGEHFHQALDNISNLHHKPYIISTVIDIDQKIKDIGKNTEHDGSTAVFALVEKLKGQYFVSVGNIGDSRAVLFKAGTKPIPLTKDHVPSMKREKMRIVKAGGTVEGGRVMGQLAVSRAFGDNALKLPTNCQPENKMVSCIPDFKDLNVTSSDYLLLTCDGIFEKEQVFTLDTLASFLAEQFRHTNDLAHICSSLLDETLRRGSRDNMTALLIQFMDGSDYHQEREEFVPGPYHEGPFLNSFQKAYILNAKSAGKTLNDAKKMYADRMAREAKEEKIKKTNGLVSSPKHPTNSDHSPKKPTDFYTDSNSKSGYESDSDSESSDSDSSETAVTRPNNSPKSPENTPKDPKPESPQIHPVPPLSKKLTDVNLFHLSPDDKPKPNKEEKRAWPRPKIRIGPRVESETEENITATTTTTTNTTTTSMNTNSTPVTISNTPKSKSRTNKKKEKQLRRKSESEIPKPRLPCDEPDDSLLKSESIPQNKKVPSKFFVSFIKHLPLKLHKIEKPEEPESESLYAMGLSPRKFSTELLESPVNVHSETSGSSNATLPTQNPTLKTKKSQPRLKMEQPLEIDKEKHKEMPKQATKQPTPLQRSKDAKSNGRVTPVSGRNGLHVTPSLPAKEESEKGLTEIDIMDHVNTKL